MKKQLLKLSLTLMALLMGGVGSAFADEFVLTPTQTTVIQANGKTTQNANTVLYNAKATSWRYSQAKINGGAFTNMLATYDGSPVVLTKFDASTTLEGKLLKKATLTFSSVCTISRRNSNVQVATINTGWDATTATWTNTNTAEILNAVGINGDGDNVGTSKKTLTYDVTSYLQASTDNTLGIALFTFTGREQEASDFKLTLEYVNAASATNYTVKYVDAAGNKIKESSTYVAESGSKPTLTADDKDAFYNADKTVKYIYDSDDAANLTIEGDGSTIVTIKFREAAKWNYTVNNNIDGNSVKGTVFEGEKVKVAFPQYILKDGVLYETDKIDDSRKQYNWTFAVNEDNTTKTINYKKTNIDNVAYYSEGENIKGLTIINNGNSAIRSSNSASAYAKDADVVFTTLPAGKYKLTSSICDFQGKKASAEFSYKAGEKVIFTHKAEVINSHTKTSEEFTLNESTPISLVKGGNDKQGIDFIYIQRTGDATETVSVSEAGFATYATTNNVKVPKDENVKVMTVKVNAEGTAIELNEVAAGTVIPAKTGILVKAPAGNCDFVVTSDKGETLANNDLKAATEDVTSADDKFFALTKLGEKVGFALVENGVVIPAGKAYLEVTKGTAAAKFFGLDGEATGINSVKTAKADGAYYTLEGVKTTKPVKGLYIHNGKKIVVK